MRISDWSSDVCSSDLEREDCEIAVKIICGFSQFDIFGEDTGHRHWIVAENFQLELIESCVDFISDLLQASDRHHVGVRSEEHTSELQSLMRISYAVFCLKKKNNSNTIVPLTIN